MEKDRNRELDVLALLYWHSGRNIWRLHTRIPEMVMHVSLMSRNNNEHMTVDVLSDE